MLGFLIFLLDTSYPEIVSSVSSGSLTKVVFVSVQKGSLFILKYEI